MILTLINTKKIASIHNRMAKGDNFAFSASLKMTIHFFISWEKNFFFFKQVFSTRKMPPQLKRTPEREKFFPILNRIQHHPLYPALHTQV